jgi:hypothetical protein
MISGEFDEANAERRERIRRLALKTADKLNGRIKYFLNDINANYSLTKSQKEDIKERLLKDLK